MLTLHLHINTCVIFCMVFLISLGEPQVLAPAPLPRNPFLEIPATSSFPSVGPSGT